MPSLPPCRPRIHASPPTSKLVGDERGAIMVAGVFMAFFLIGMLYFLIGIGDAIFHRERLQDAADAAAYSAAVMHARGMNFIVLINLVMAALLAVLVALRLIEALSLVAIGVLMGTAWLFPGAGAAAFHTEHMVRRPSNTAYKAAQPIVNPTLMALNKAATAATYLVPAVAQLRTIDTVVGHYRPEAEWGVAVPGRLALPVEDGDFGVLCGKAGETAGDVALFPLKPILPGMVENAVAGALGNFTQGLSAWFCGKPGAQAPRPVTTAYDAGYPQLSELTACRDFRVRAAHEEAKAETLCKKAERALARSTPHPQTGACTDVDCGRDSPYQRRLRLARRQCDPSRHGNIKEYRWQQRLVEIDEAYDPKLQRWVEVARREGPHVRIVNAHPPCGKEGTIATAWLYDDRGEVDMPLCETPRSQARAAAEAIRLANATDSASRTSRVRTLRLMQVTQLLGCIRREKTPPVKLQKPRAHAARPSLRCDGATSLKAPKRLEKGLRPGAGAFQLRSVVFGSRPPRGAEKVIRIATWGHDAPSWSRGMSRIADWMRLFAAQSEYFYGQDHPRGEWMWHMSWQARLRRFRLSSGDENTTRANSQPRGGSSVTSSAGGTRRNRKGCVGSLSPPATSLEDACNLVASGAEGGGSCSSLRKQLHEMQQLVIH